MLFLFPGPFRFVNNSSCESRYMVYGTLVFPARPLYYVQNRGKRAAQRQASLLEQDLKTEIF